MMNYLKSLVIGGQKAQSHKNDRLVPGDISTILTAEDFEEIITGYIDDIVTLYQLEPSQKALNGGVWQKKVAIINAASVSIETKLVEVDNGK